MNKLININYCVHVCSHRLGCTILKKSNENHKTSYFFHLFDNGRATVTVDVRILTINEHCKSVHMSWIGCSCPNLGEQIALQ